MAGELVNPDGTPWTPAFAGQRPPFQPGNQLAIKHGANSPYRVDPLAHQFRDEILSSPDMQYLTKPQYAATFWSYCRTAARVQLLEDYVDAMSMTEATRSDKGQTSALELLRKWTATLITLAARMGLDPLSYAKLGKDVVSTQVDLAKLLSDRPDGSNKPST
jgi:hypothetical protein